ncbi:hypothetical protein FB451DRAFT_1190748 [Mycena latifolia]|nr:hypothetical protein FB451DRAFT_1190748 [Mycena latifolia]
MGDRLAGTHTAFQLAMRILKRPAVPVPPVGPGETLKDREARYQKASVRIFGKEVERSGEGDKDRDKEMEKKSGAARDPRGPQPTTAAGQKGFKARSGRPPPPTTPTPTPNPHPTLAHDPPPVAAAPAPAVTGISRRSRISAPEPSQHGLGLSVHQVHAIHIKANYQLASSLGSNGYAPNRMYTAHRPLICDLRTGTRNLMDGFARPVGTTVGVPARWASIHLRLRYLEARAGNIHTLMTFPAATAGTPYIELQNSRRAD